MKNKVYNNNYISTPSTLSLSWLKFVEERRNNSIKEYDNSQFRNRSACNECNIQGCTCNNTNFNMQTIVDPICLKSILGPINTNTYGFFTSSISYPDILDSSKLINFDYESLSNNNSIFNEDSDIYITERGIYKVTYGVVCSTAINSRLSLLLNNREACKQSQLNKVGLTKYITQLRLNSGDILSLMVKGEFIKLFDGAINGFALVEKCS